MEGLEKYSLRTYLIPFQVGLLVEWKILHLHFQGKFYITPDFRFLGDFLCRLKMQNLRATKIFQIFAKKLQNSVKNAQIP